MHGIIPAHCRGHQISQQSLSIVLLLFCLLLPGRPLGQYGQVVAQWWRPVASRVALDMPHWKMPSVLHRRLYCISASARPSKWAAMEVHFDVIVNSVIDHNHSLITCYSQYKLKMRRRCIHYNTLSPIVYYGLPLMTMDAILATIFAGGQAQI
jgi:hypothetical protein